MKYEDAVKIVEPITESNQCNNECIMCPLYTLCDTFPNMSKDRIASAWLGRGKGERGKHENKSI